MHVWGRLAQVRNGYENVPLNDRAANANTASYISRADEPAT
jgi:hypothetical protein